MRRVLYVANAGSVAANGLLEQNRYVLRFARPGKVVAISAVTDTATAAAQAATRVLIRDETDRGAVYSGQNNALAYVPLAAISPANGERMAMNSPVRRDETWVLTFTVAVALGAAVVPTIVFWVDEEEDDGKPIRAC